MKNSKISWKKENISVMINGTTIFATVFWWSKEYYIEICEPFSVKLAGAKMMYAVPCKFVFRGADKSSEVALFDECVQKIKKYFQKNCKIAINQLN